LLSNSFLVHYHVCSVLHKTWLSIGHSGGSLLRTHIAFVEEVSEEEEIAEIHNGAVAHVFVRVLAVTRALRLDVVRGRVDNEPHRHLSNLDAGDEDAHPARCAELHGAHGVVRVHE